MLSAGQIREELLQNEKYSFEELQAVLFASLFFLVSPFSLFCSHVSDTKRNQVLPESVDNLHTEAWIKVTIRSQIVRTYLKDLFFKWEKFASLVSNDKKKINLLKNILEEKFSSTKFTTSFYLSKHGLVEHFYDNYKKYRLEVFSEPKEKYLKKYLKACFLFRGSFTQSKNQKRLEFTAHGVEEKDFIYWVLTALHLDFSFYTKGKYYVFYTKDSEKISKSLVCLGAHTSYLQFENDCIEKELQKKINRQVNCDQGNIKRQNQAINKWFAPFTRLIEHSTFQQLSPDLQEVVYLRLQYPEHSLEDLGHLCKPKLSKTQVNYRIKKILDTFIPKEEEVSQ